jgi:hypothetical protein
MQNNIISFNSNQNKEKKYPEMKAHFQLIYMKNESCEFNEERKQNEEEIRIKKALKKREKNF